MVKVATGGAVTENLEIPTTFTWRLAVIGVTIIFIGLIITIVGTIFLIKEVILFGVTTTFIMGVLLILLPYHIVKPNSPSSIKCTLILILGSCLIASTLLDAWPAILFWFLTGVILYSRCDTWCCNCFDETIIDRQHHKILIPNVTNNLATIRLPRPSISIGKGKFESIATCQAR